MTGWSTQVARAIAESHDFSRFQTIVDVGGGYGALLASILLRTPGARGVVFDQPHVLEAEWRLLPWRFRNDQVDDGSADRLGFTTTAKNSL